MCVSTSRKFCFCLTQAWLRHRKNCPTKLTASPVRDAQPLCGNKCRPETEFDQQVKSNVRNCILWLWLVMATGKYHSWQVHITLFAVTIVCFSSAIKGEFVHDDMEAITKNPDVNGQNSIYQIFFNDFWGRPMWDPLSHKSYRPLTVLTFRLNMMAVEDEERVKTSWMFRSINVALHALLVQLIVITLVYGLRCSYTTAFIISFHFATHPIHTEAVSSSVGRADILCAIFCLISFLNFCRAIRETISITRMLSFLVITCVSSLLALLSKETGIAILPICVVYYLFKLSEKGSVHELISRAPMEGIKSQSCKQKEQKTLPSINFDYFLHLLGPLIIPVIMLINLVWFRLKMLYGSLPLFTEQDNPAAFSDSQLTRSLTYLYLCAFNWRLLLVPWTLSYDWQMGSIPLVASFCDIRNLETFFYGMILIAIIWNRCRYIADCICNPKSKCFLSITNQEIINQRLLFVALCFLIIPFMPACNLFFTVGFVVAERVLYLPSFGFSILFAVGYQNLMQKLSKPGEQTFRSTKFAFYCLMFAFAMKTICQNQVWQNRESLFTAGVKTVPNNAKMHYNFANLQRDLGNTQLAIHHYRVALSLWPNHESSWNNLATLLSDPQAAEYHLKQALRVNPFHPKAHFNLACIYSKKGLLSEAVSLLKRSIQLDSNFAEPLSSLASLYSQLGHNEDANELHLKALHIQSKNPDMINNYGAFLQKTGNTEAAIKQYQKALKINPKHKTARANLMQIWKSLNFTHPKVAST